MSVSVTGGCYCKNMIFYFVDQRQNSSLQKEIIFKSDVLQKMVQAKKKKYFCCSKTKLKLKDEIEFSKKKSF
jgi:hypothetical protein